MRLITTFVLILFITGLSNAQKTVQYDKATYNIGICLTDDMISCFSKDLINLDVKYTFLTLLKEENIPEIHNKFGANYLKNYCLPIVHSTIRKYFANYSIKEIFSQKMDEIINILSSELIATFQKDHIILQEILFESIELPDNIKISMENVMVTEQDLLAQKNKLEIEKINSEIKLLEAKNFASYNQILNSTLTEKVIQLKYIEMLSELCKSQNTKIIVLGNKPDLPILIDEK